VVLEQFSPVLPNNYRESSYPVAVYRWHADNPTDKAVTVSVLLSWTNMSGWFRTFTRDFAGCAESGQPQRSYASERIAGVRYDARASSSTGTARDLHPMNGTASSPLRRSIAWRRSQLSNHLSGKRRRQEPFGLHSRKDGMLADDAKSWVSDKEKLAGAIALRFTLQPGETKVIPMVIAWDFPLVQFGEGRKWNRRYTDFYGTSGRNAWKIARDGLLHAAEWSDEIDKWQAPIVNDESKPMWYRGMLFNELYALTDGGTFWGREAGSDPGKRPSFALLECFDYAYYGTLDVGFYASLPLLKFWPDIDKQRARGVCRYRAEGVARARAVGMEV
jgi:non-lysosomal glucosylceramidase